MTGSVGPRLPVAGVTDSWRPFVAHWCRDGMSSIFSESGMGSYRVGSGMTGVDANSGWDGVASGRGVEAEGPPVGGAPRVGAGGEDGSGRVGSGTGSGRCSDGPASTAVLED